MIQDRFNPLTARFHNRMDSYNLAKRRYESQRQRITIPSLLPQANTNLANGSINSDDPYKSTMRNAAKRKLMGMNYG